jgi:hypothetical protein
MPPSTPTGISVSRLQPTSATICMRSVSAVGGLVSVDFAQLRPSEPLFPVRGQVCLGYIEASDVSDDRHYVRRTGHSADNPAPFAGQIIDLLH